MWVTSTSIRSSLERKAFGRKKTEKMRRIFSYLILQLIILTCSSVFSLSPLADDSGIFPTWQQPLDLSYDEQGVFQNFKEMNGATTCGQDKFLLMSGDERTISVRHKSGRLLQIIDFEPLLSSIAEATSASVICPYDSNANKVGVTLYREPDDGDDAVHTNSISAVYDLDANEWSQKLWTVQLAAGKQDIFVRNGAGSLFRVERKMKIAGVSSLPILDANDATFPPATSTTEILHFAASSGELICTLNDPAEAAVATAICRDLSHSFPTNEHVSFDFGYQVGRFTAGILFFYTPVSIIGCDINLANCRVVTKDRLESDELFLRHNVTSDGAAMTLHVSVEHRDVAGKRNSGTLRVVSDNHTIIYDSKEQRFGRIEDAELISLGEELFLLIYLNNDDRGSVLVKRIY